MVLVTTVHLVVLFIYIFFALAFIFHEDFEPVGFSSDLFFHNNDWSFINFLLAYIYVVMFFDCNWKPRAHMNMIPDTSSHIFLMESFHFQAPNNSRQLLHKY